jgi:dihydroorotase
VTPHHLTLTENACEGYDTHAKMNPPLRTEQDLESLREAVRDGTIDVIATDHAPHHYDAKEREFADAPFGIVGLETALGVLITDLVQTGVLDLRTLVDRLACRPAAIFNLPGGTLAKGAPAHITVFDPELEWSVDPGAFISKGRNTPYAERLLRGRACYTIVDGKVIYRLAR